MSPPPDTSAAGGDRLDRAIVRIGCAVVLGSIMSVLDTTIVNVALNTLSIDLHTSLDSIQWVVTAYLLALAAVIPISGWATRRFGTKRLYIASIVLFTLGSALCGLAWSTTSLVAFRVLQGIGGGLILPVGQTALARAAGPRRIGRAMSMVGIPTVLAPIIGPTVGGLLLEHLNWHWIFYVNIPVGIVAVIVAVRFLPTDRPEPAGRLDVTGLVLLAVGLPAAIYGLAEIQSGSTVRWVVSLVAGLGLIVGFAWHARRVTTPLLDIRLYQKPTFVAASVATFCLGAAIFGGMILLPLLPKRPRHRPGGHRAAADTPGHRRGHRHGYHRSARRPDGRRHRGPRRRDHHGALHPSARLHRCPYVVHVDQRHTGGAAA